MACFVIVWGLWSLAHTHINDKPITLLSVRCDMSEEGFAASEVIEQRYNVLMLTTKQILAEDTNESSQVKEGSASKVTNHYGDDRERDWYQKT